MTTKDLTSEVELSEIDLSAYQTALKDIKSQITLIKDKVTSGFKR